MITAFTASQVGPSTWLLAWVSDATAPSYRVYRDGLLISRPGAAELLVAIAAGESPVFDVLDDDSDPAPDRHPAFVTLAWQASPDATAYYRVDQYIDSAWTEQARVIDDGRGSFTWASGRLADCTTHQFRVVPISAGGHVGTATPFAMLVVRNPDVPRVGYAYNAATGVVLVSAA
jgi:hypothetical protein